MVVDEQILKDGIERDQRSGPLARWVSRFDGFANRGCDDDVDILLVPGMTGCSLDQGCDLKNFVWPNPLVMLAGETGPRTALTEDGLHDKWPHQDLKAGAPLWFIYGAATTAWRLAGHSVWAVRYDWRKSLEAAAEELERVSKKLWETRKKRQLIVSHSMGGPVVARWGWLHPEGIDRTERIVFAGAPLSGCMTPLQSFVGTDPFIQSLIKVFPANKVDDFRTAAVSFPALMSLLPDPAVFGGLSEQLYHRERYQAGFQPRQLFLDMARNYVINYRHSPAMANAVGFASTHHETVWEVEDRGGLAWPSESTTGGDGVVPTFSAVPPGLKAWQLQETHPTIPLDLGFIGGVLRLAKGKEPELPVVPSDETLVADVVPVAARAVLSDAEAAELRAAWVKGEPTVHQMLRFAGAR